MSKEYLKYELCFLYQYTRNREVFGELDPHRNYDFILEMVHNNFPYESKSVLRGVQDRVIQDITEGQNPEERLLYMQEVFQQHLNSISSKNFYHFTGTLNYLVSAIENGGLYPSIPGHRESFGFQHKGFSIPKEFKKSDEISWTEKKLEDLGQEIQSTKFSDLEDVIRKSEFPVFSCFTEMPENALPFHAHHYGFFGIAFNKRVWQEEVLISKVLNKHISDDNSSFGLYPVSYIDTDESLAYKMVLETFFTEEDPVKKRALAFELLKFKPTQLNLSNHDHMFSVYFEREWRYISTLGPFKFEPHAIEYIFIESNLHSKYESPDFDNMEFPEKADLLRLKELRKKHFFVILPIEKLDLTDHFKSPPVL